MWISPEFKIYLIKEFQRLKDDESRRLSLAWNLNRTLSKLNYRIHTDAIKAHLIPPTVTKAQAARQVAPAGGTPAAKVPAKVSPAKAPAAKAAVRTTGAE